MDVRLTVKFDDGRELEITAGPRDQLAWEKAAPGRAFGTLLAGMAGQFSELKISDMYSLAFATMRRQNLFTGTEKELAETADVQSGHTLTKPDSDDVDVSNEDPTPPGPSTGA